jgi:hypothetical protein
MLHRSGPNVRPLLAAIGHIARMACVEVPEAALAPRPPCAALADRARRRGVRDESIKDGGSAHGRAPLRPVYAWALLLLLSFGSATVHAEPAGRMGPTSRATVQISLSVAPRLEVSRSSVEADGSSGAPGSQSFCVWSNSGVGSYSISASDASDPSAGEPAAMEPGFAVQLAGGGAGTMPLALAPGATATGLAAASGLGCGSGRLVGRPATMAGGDAPAQSGALLLLVAPD